MPVIIMFGIIVFMYASLYIFEKYEECKKQAIHDNLMKRRKEWKKKVSSYERRNIWENNNG